MSSADALAADILSTAYSLVSSYSALFAIPLAIAATGLLLTLVVRAFQR